MIDIQKTVCRPYCACDSISRNSLFLKLFGTRWNSTFTILFLMSVENISLFNSVLDEALERLGKKNLKLKECQYEAVKAVVVDQKDTICILPSGYGNSLIYQLLPFVLLNYLFPTHSQHGRHTVFCMSITDYPRAPEPPFPSQGIAGSGNEIGEDWVSRHFEPNNFLFKVPVFCAEIYNNNQYLCQYCTIINSYIPLSYQY